MLWKGKAALVGEKPTQTGLEAWLKKFSLFKPGRRLGGSWIGDRVACRKPVNLCPSCLRRYGRWYSLVNYRPDWDYQRWTTDCDGCGEVMAYDCTGFYPEETCFDVMSSDKHFRKANPNRRLFSR